MFRLIVLTLAVIIATVDADFPNDPKPCGYGDTNCIKDIITFLLEQKPDGYSALNFGKIDPVRLPPIDLKQGEESPVTFDLQFRNTDLVGMSKAKVTSVKGFGKDLTGDHEVHTVCAVTSLVGEYKIAGKVLVLPVQGAGLCNITMINIETGVHFSGTPEVRSDGTYMVIKNMRIVFNPKRVYFEFGNLFNGDKALGDNVNAFVNKNWKEIYHEVQGSIEKSFGPVFQKFLNNVFQKYPYDKFFA